MSASARGAARRALRFRCPSLVRIPGNQITDNLGSITPMRVTGHGGKEGRPQAGLKPEGVTRRSPRPGAHPRLPWRLRDYVEACAVILDATPPRRPSNIVYGTLSLNGDLLGQQCIFPVRKPMHRLVIYVRPPRLRLGVLLPANPKALGNTDIEQCVVGSEQPIDRRTLAHRSPCFIPGRCGISSISPTYQRANFRSTADRLESGSARLTASSRRSQRSSSKRIRRNGVPSGAITSAFLSLTAYPLMWVACSVSMPYDRDDEQEGGIQCQT